MQIRLLVPCCASLALVWTTIALGQEGEFTDCCTKARAAKAYLNQSIPQQNYTCGQTFNTNSSPAYDLEVTYAYCKQQCAKYEKSSPDKPNQWAVPLVGYILPAVIFSMTIPRPFKVEVPDVCFNLRLSKCDAFYKVPLSLLVASIFIIADTTFWVVFIFAGAGPMLFSGILEGVLDYVVVTRLQEHEEHGSTTLRLSRSGRVDLLTSIVAGNLVRTHNDPKGTLADELSVSNDSNGAVPRTETGLLSMMGTQQSFGAIVGAPVIFYIGSFIYNVLDLSSKTGDNDTAHTLAFGIWWMVILHVAIVSGCLLASNNPATAGAIARTPSQDRDQKWWQVWTPVYDSIFLPAWMHDRGSNKMGWIKEIRRSPAWADAQNQWFDDKIRLDSMNWFGITFAAITLIFIPCFLAGIVSYNTPKIGLSCRSLTFLLYFCSQVVLILWNLYRHIIAQSDGPRRLQVRSKRIYIVPLMFLVGLAMLVSVFTTVAGTLLQLIGVYRNCACGILASEWPDPWNATIPLASDTATSRHSSKYWSGTGYAAVGFIAFVCYVGWWYQRFLRNKFVKKARLVTADQGGRVVLSGVAVPSDGIAAASSTNKDLDVELPTFQSSSDVYSPLRLVASNIQVPARADSAVHSLQRRTPSPPRSGDLDAW